MLAKMMAGMVQIRENQQKKKTTTKVEMTASTIP